VIFYLCTKLFSLAVIKHCFAHVYLSKCGIKLLPTRPPLTYMKVWMELLFRLDRILNFCLDVKIVNQPLSLTPIRAVSPTYRLRDLISWLMVSNNSPELISKMCFYCYIGSLVMKDKEWREKHIKVSSARSSWGGDLLYAFGTAKKTNFSFFPLLNRSSNLSLSLHNKLLIYKAIVRPTLSLSCPAWNFTSDTNINKPQTIT
jgi:hypothetical protein